MTSDRSPWTAGPRPRAGGAVRLLDIDAELGGTLEPEQRAAALEIAVARTLILAPGTASELPRIAGESYVGLLVCEGTALRSVTIAGRSTASVVGRGDLISPDGAALPELIVPASSDWRVLSPLRVAVLDRDLLRRIQPWPEIVHQLAARGDLRARRVATHQAIAAIPGVELRLLVLLWQLASDWGIVTPDGLRLDIPLTHDVLAMLVMARRPTVTSALSRLRTRGFISSRPGRGWLLRAEPAFTGRAADSIGVATVSELWGASHRAEDEEPEAAAVPARQVVRDDLVARLSEQQRLLTQARERHEHAVEQMRARTARLARTSDQLRSTVRRRRPEEAEPVPDGDGAQETAAKTPSS